MNCLEFRRRLGAEPGAADAVIDAHARQCATCARYRDDMRAMDSLLARAMRVDMTRLQAARKPAAGSAPAPEESVAGRPLMPRRWMAMAASLVAGVLVAATLWVSYPKPSLAREVIDHALHEPYSWTAEQVVAPGRLEDVLGPSGISLRSGSGDVTYAKRCFFAGHWVPHLVVRTAEGPVTVLMLLHRDVDAATAVAEQGLAGVVLPAPRGSIAVVGRDLPDVDAIAMQVFEAVDWDA